MYSNCLSITIRRIKVRRIACCPSFQYIPVQKCGWKFRRKSRPGLEFWWKFRFMTSKALTIHSAPPFILLNTREMKARSVKEFLETASPTQYCYSLGIKKESSTSKIFLSVKTKFWRKNFHLSLLSPSLMKQNFEKIRPVENKQKKRTPQNVSLKITDYVSLLSIVSYFLSFADICYVLVSWKFFKTFFRKCLVINLPDFLSCTE